MRKLLLGWWLVSIVLALGMMGCSQTAVETGQEDQASSPRQEYRTRGPQTELQQLKTDQEDARIEHSRAKAEIDRLNRENATLRRENEELKRKLRDHGL
jgi:uncharacterized protein HemX